MRVTQSMISETFLRNLNTNLKRLADKNDMLASRKKIRRPSDDPVGTVLALKLRRQLTAIEQYNSNAKDALTWMKNTETALANVGEIMHRLNDLTIEAANGHMTLEDREKILNEVTELKEQIFQEANSTNVDRYLFSGYKTDVPPFVKDERGKIVTNPMLLEGEPSSVVGLKDGSQFFLDECEGITSGKYKIEIEVIEGSDTINVKVLNSDGDEIASANNISTSEKVEINNSDNNLKLVLDYSKISIPEDGIIDFELLPEGTMDFNLGKSENIPVNLIGPEIFTDIFKTVEALEDALENNNIEALSGELLGKIKDGTNTVLKYRSQIGARSNRLDATILRLGANSVDYEELLSDTIGVELERLITELKMDESVYRMALAVGARIIQPNLTDFLR